MTTNSDHGNTESAVDQKSRMELALLSPEGIGIAPIELKLLEHIPIPIALGTSSGALIFMNRAGRELIGLDRIDESTKLAISDFARPANPLRFDGGLPDHPWQGEMVVQNLKNGEAVPLLVKLLTLHSAAGLPCGYAWIGMETGTQNLASSVPKVHDLQLHYARKVEFICGLAGSVAHQLNNMLLVINEYSSMLIEELAIDPNLAAQAASIHRAGERTVQLVQELLSLQNLRTSIIAGSDIDQTTSGSKEYQRLSSEHHGRNEGL